MFVSRHKDQVFTRTELSEDFRIGMVAIYLSSLPPETVMAPDKTQTELPPSTDEIPWRRAWLTKSQVGNPNPEPRARMAVRMTPSRRLEKLHRLRAALEPPRSWLNKK